MANAPKKKRKGKPQRSPDIDPGAEEAQIVDADAGAVMAPFGGTEDGNPPSIDIVNDDNTVTIQFQDDAPPKKPSNFDDNLAEDLDDIILGRISNDLLEAVDQDISDRSEWIQQRSEGLDLLGWKIERPGGGNVGTSSTAVPGQSTVRDGILGEACDRFQANAFAELCPSEGPCKVIDYGKETTETDGLAEEFEKDMNFYLTTTAREYYPDTREMLFWTGYASGMFKKIYKCPLRNRPVSERVDGADLIVPSNATDLHNAGRITHQINMRQSIMKRMQILGVYRNVPLTAPTPQPNTLTTKTANIVGMNPLPQREQDQDYTIYECYCELDIEGFEHKQNGEATGLPLPYRVTLDKDSRVILEIRRSWNPPKDDDEDTLPTAKIPFVLFPYGTGLGFYGTGLLHRLGNYAMALTAMLRECIDAGMFASFPGFLFAKPLGRQLQNEFRVPPGGGAPIDVSAVGNDINKAVMPLPYKDVSTAMVALMGQTRENASRYGGTAEAPTGEGVVNAPVGSVLAAIDQATRIEGGVHKALYAAQREELEQFKELFRDDPEALWRGNKRPAMGPDHATRLARFKQALENCDLVPASDPNVPSHMHRLAKANTYLQTAMGLMPANVFDLKKVVSRWAAMVKIDDVDQDFAPPQPQLPNPALLKLQIDKQNADTKAAEAQAKVDLAHAQIQSKEQIEATKIAAQHVAGASQQPDASRQVKETLTYKDAPPDIQRQIEAQAGLIPSQTQATPEQAPPDPLQSRALDLKDRQIQQADAKMAMDHHHRTADRESKETIESMKIGQALAVHPESQPIVNSELEGLSSFMTPAKEGAQAPMGAGGRVKDDGLSEEQQRAAKLAALIQEYLRDNPNPGYLQ